MEKIKVCYCPTMQPYAEKIFASVEEAEAVPVMSAAQALNLLRSGQVDSVLIGRAAQSFELDPDTKEKRLMNGLTLVYRQKGGLPTNSLKQIPAFTYLSDEELGELKGLFGQVTKFETLDDCLADGLQTPVIIDWRDYRDEFELLIPMLENGKDPRFRAPVLYYKELPESFLEKVEKAISEGNGK